MDAVPRSFIIVNGIGDSVVAFRGALVRELVARGHRVIVSTPTPIERAAQDVEAEVRALGAECVLSPLDRAGVNPLRERATRAHFRALFNNIKPDGVFAANPKAVFHAIPAARAAGVARRVAMITGLGYAFTANTLRARILRVLATKLYRGAMRDATTVLFQNQADRREFERRGLISAAVTDAEVGVAGRSNNQPTHGPAIKMVAGSGVDLLHFPQVPPPPVPVFLMVARLLGDKGVREFVAAARIVREKRSDCRFRLVGWIDANPSAIAVAELDAWVREGVIEYAGRLDDVRDELARCSVFVLPSYREGTPKSTLEALATGRAIVTTDAPGCRETVERGINGTLVAPRDANALAEACLKFATDARLREKMGAASRALAESRFDVRAVNATIAEALGA